MKKTIYTLCLLSFASILLSGCVSRTYSSEPSHRGSGSGRSAKDDPNARVIEKKRIWFWQDEFRNP